jgi:hypothetical protein
VIMTAIMPTIKPNIEHEGTKTQTQMATTDPLLFRVWMYHTEIHYRLKLERPLDPECDFLLLYSQIVKALSERMQDANTACSDVNILCVLGLTTYGSQELKQHGRTRWPSQGPLTSLNALDILGRLPLVQEHIKGLELLVMLRGGIKNIKTVGIAPLVSL